MPQSNILIIDNEITESMKNELRNSGYQITCASDGVQALRLLDSFLPNLIIIDLKLADSAEFCKTIKEKPYAPIIMLSAQFNCKEVIEGLNNGADDYIIKPFSPQMLVARVRAVLRNTMPYYILDSSKVFLDYKTLVIDEQRNEVNKNGDLISLTPNEFKILLTLTKHPNKAFSREELIKECIGEDYQGLERVVDTHIKNIRQKLGDNGKAHRYIQTVQGIGYRIATNHRSNIINT